MNLSKDAACALAKEVLKNSPAFADSIDIVICPPFVYLEPVHSLLDGNKVFLGAQDLFHEKNGAFTGEISASQLLDVGCKFVIIGHSERRHVIGETDRMINKKLRYSIENGLEPIFCIGEKLEERLATKTFDVISRQLDEGFEGLPKERIEDMVIAYEPVWAIGTGHNATPEQAQEVHAFVRKKTGAKRILYGGSVNTSNSRVLIQKEDINGFLVGGASLKADSFLDIVRSCL